MTTVALPEVAKKPCVECPWRRDSAQGWLGPWSKEEWADLASSDEPIACHLTLSEHRGWRSPAAKQCAGAAIYRGNTCKMTHDGVALLPADRDLVFSNRREFYDHHDLANRKPTTMPEPILATHITCVECDEITELDRPMTTSEAEDEYCPNDTGHAVSGVHVTDKPLEIEGLPDDDYWHHGRERYEYDMQDVDDALDPTPPVLGKAKPKMSES